MVLAVSGSQGLAVLVGRQAGRAAGHRQTGWQAGWQVACWLDLPRFGLCPCGPEIVRGSRLGSLSLWRTRKTGLEQWSQWCE